MSAQSKKWGLAAASGNKFRITLLSGILPKLAHHYAEYSKIHGWPQYWKGCVGWNQYVSVIFTTQCLEGEFIIDNRNHNIAYVRSPALLDGHNISSHNPCIHHRIPVDFYQHCFGGLPYQEVVNAQRLIHLLQCRCGITGLHGTFRQFPLKEPLARLEPIIRRSIQVAQQMQPGNQRCHRIL